MGRSVRHPLRIELTSNGHLLTSTLSIASIWHKYGALDGDQTHYLVVIGLPDKFLTTRGCPMTIYIYILFTHKTVLFQTIRFSISTKLNSSKYCYIHHHHHIALVARISLTLSRHSSLSFIALGRSSGQHPVSSHSC